MIEYYRPTGKLTSGRAVQELGLNTKQAYAEPKPLWLIDLQQADIADNDHSSLLDFARQVYEQWQRSACDSGRFVIVAIDDLTVGLSNVICAYIRTKGEQLQAQVMRSEEEALAWLRQANLAC